MEDIERAIIKYLEGRPRKAASSMEIMNDLNLEISMHALTALLERMERDGSVRLHQQSRSYAAPKYDLILLTDEVAPPEDQ